MPNWSDEHDLRLLREITYYYLYRSSGQSGQEGGKTLLQFAKEILKIAPGDEPSAAVQRNIMATYQAIRRFLYYETRITRDHETLGRLFDQVVGWLIKNRQQGEIARSQFIYVLEQRRWFDDLAQPLEGEATRERDERYFALSAVEMFKTFFGISDREFENAAKNLTGHERCRDHAPHNNDRSFFLTYRYSDKPGYVIKTLTTVTPPSQKYPYCAFVNFFNNYDSTILNESRGVAVRLDSGIYMLGKVNTGEAIKLFVFEHFTVRGKLNSGLLLTTSETGKPVASRVVLERVPIIHSSQMGPSVISFENIDSIHPEIRRRLRNYTEFEVGPQLTMLGEDGKEAKISVGTLVEVVGRLCDGRFRLAGEALNPASHDQYPFNQALTIYDSKER